MRFEFGLGPSDATRRQRGPVRRLLTLSDLRGNGALPAEPLSARRIAKVDVDNLDAVLARHAPAIQLGPEAGGERVEIRRFDDFHPDTLVGTLTVFTRLRDLRTRLGHPSTFAGAVAELAADGPAPPAARPTAVGPDASQPSIEGGGGVSTLDELLHMHEPARAPAGPADGRTESGRYTPMPGTIDALIRQAVAPHIVPAPSPQLSQMLSAVDAAMTDLMRAVLHDRSFQQVESTWRAVQWLVSTLELGETLELHLLHVTRDELAQAAQGGELWRRLVQRESRPAGGLEPAALIGNVAFGSSVEDIALLEHLGALAAALGVPFMAGASPDLPDETRWQALRTHPAASHIGLALPRFLLRLPYGVKTDPIAAFTFEEQPTPPDHEAFLWGNGAFAYAVIVARALDPDGDSSAAALDGLPAFVYQTDDGPKLQPPAEINMSDAAVAAVQSRGLMPLISLRDRDAIRLVPPHSIALPVGDLLQ